MNDNKLLMEFKDIFICPDSREELQFVKKNDADGNFINKYETRFGAKKGVVDFVGHEFTERILKRGKDSKGDLADQYDELLTSKDIVHKIFNGLAWGEDLRQEVFINPVKVLLTELQKGFIMDFPILTSITSEPIYRDFSHMKFVAGDYSASFLSKSYQNLWGRKVENVILMQANPSRLPIRDNIFDAVISINGLNFFKEFSLAVKEMYRVLKPGGRILGSCYVAGKNKTGDKVIDYFLTKKEIFKSVFNKDELNSALKGTGFVNLGFSSLVKDVIVQFMASKPNA